MHKPIKAITNIFYPTSCLGCQNPLLAKEEWVCLKCFNDFPHTHFHKRLSNPVTESFTGRVPILRGTAFLHFQRGGVVQQLIHALKYKNKPGVGHFLGQCAGKDMARGSFFKSADALVPVPLHPAKEKKRGYNQALAIANGLSQATQIPVAPLLQRVTASPSQTSKSRYDRFLNVNTIFKLNPNLAQNWQGKHLVVIDDVLTTGATLEGCLLELKAIPKVKLSVFTVAYAA
jgi:ComF family protein